MGASPMTSRLIRRPKLQRNLGGVSGRRRKHRIRKDKAQSKNS